MKNFEESLLIKMPMNRNGSRAATWKNKKNVLQTYFRQNVLIKFGAVGSIPFQWQV